MRGEKLSNAETAALLACRNADGSWTSDGIIEAARDPENALHHRLTWDNEVAGHICRTQEAREIIHLATLQIVYEEKTLLVPMLVHDPTTPGQCYRSTQQLADEDPETAARVLAYTLTTAKGHLARAQSLATIFRLDGSLGDVILQLEAIIEALNENDDDDDDDERPSPPSPTATL